MNHKGIRGKRRVGFNVLIFMKNNYELALVLSSRLDDKGRDELLGLIEKMVKQFDGEVSKREDGGRKVLAYPIKKEREGVYYFWQVQLPGEAVNRLSVKLNVEEKLLRYLIVSKGTKKKEKPEMKKEVKAEDEAKAETKAAEEKKDPEKKKDSPKKTTKRKARKSRA